MKEYPLALPDISDEDIQAVVNVLRTPNLSLGPKIPEFEQAIADYTGIKYAAAVNSGTSALFLGLVAKEINKKEYEVITSSYTFIASANVAIHAGATPVFAEIDEDTFNITPDSVMEQITSNTKALIPVDIFGKPIDIKGFRQIADDHDLFLLEDSCEALGTLVNDNHIGKSADAATFAFYPNKQITTGEGGIIASNDKKFIEIIKSLRNQGRAAKAGWLVHDRIGYNFRISDIAAVLGISQLSRIEEFITIKRKIVNCYSKYLGGNSKITLIKEGDNERISWFVFVIRINFSNTKFSNRDDFIDVLKTKGIFAGRYFSSVHLQPIYQELFNYSSGYLPITETISTQTLALPFYNSLTEDDIKHISNEVLELLE